MRASAPLGCESFHDSELKYYNNNRKKDESTTKQDNNN